MEDFTPYQSVKGQVDFHTLAALRYEIHVAVAALDDPEHLRGLLSYAQAAKSAELTK